MKIDRDILLLKDRIKKYRQELHRIPEIGFDLYKTHEYIVNELKIIGYEDIEVLAKVGIRVSLLGNPGIKTLAFRADMDGLLIDEKTSRDFASVHQGAMHACGHDGHMAILLGFAKWLYDKKGRLEHNIVLIFQPDEENEGGALPMVEEGVLHNPRVDAIFGFHIMPDFPEGKIALKAGPMMAQTSEVDIIIRGISAHGAMPHKGIDAIVAAAHFITSLQSIISRRIDPKESAVFSIGRISGGDTRNILAKEVILNCTVRTFDDDLYDNIKFMVINLLKSMELSHGIEGEYIEMVYYPAVINDKDLTDKIIEMLPEESFIEAEALMISEDFSYYQREVPGVFMFLGSRNEEKGFVNPLHSNEFDFDETILLTGIQLYKNIICNF